MTFYGSKELVEDDWSLDFTQTNGQTWTRRYRGGKEEVSSAYNSAIAAGLRARMDPIGNGYWSLVVVYAGGETASSSDVLSDVWELAGNDLEKSLWELPAVQTELRKIVTTDDLARLRSDITSYVGGDYLAPPHPSDPSKKEVVLSEDYIMTNVNRTAMNPDVIRNLIRALAAGVEAYPVSAFVLRNTKTVPANSILRPSYTNLNKMLTPGTLVSAESIPSSLLFNIPDGGYWLKKSPTVTVSNQSRTQFQQEWVHCDEYERSIYGDPL